MRPIVSLTVALATVGIAAGLAAVPAAADAPTCHVRYVSQDQGFGRTSVNVGIRNFGAPIDGWAVRFTLPTPGHVITGGTFGAVWTQVGQRVTGANLPTNAVLTTNGTVVAGFTMQGGALPTPTSFTLNDAGCSHEIVIGPVYDPPPPIVALTSPNSFTTYTAPATVSITAYASSIAGVARVEFLADGELLAVDAAAPYAFTWTGVTGEPGTAVTHLLTARMIDARGAVATSSPRVITVVTPA